jgi:hypothetical protein
MPNSHPFVTAINILLEKLDAESSINTGIDLANEILSLLGIVDKKSTEEVFESSIELPNAERYDSWFQPHPIFKSDRACFDLADANLFQAKFYWLKKHSRQIVAGGVHFTPNFEDEDFTHNDRYKVGVDFFLSPNGKSLQIALSNRGNLRIVELNKRLNSTQVDIFTKWEGAGNLSTQEALHTTLWESFKLKSVNQKFYDGVSNSFTDLLQHLGSIDKDEEESKLFASRLLGRLLFCWFLRKKGIINEGMGYFDANGQESTEYYRSNLEKLFFLTLNTPVDERDELHRQHQKQLFTDLVEDQQPSLFKTDQRTPYLNGGLFEPHENDWFKDNSLTFPNGFFVNLYNHFDEFNFTTDESSPEYELIAIDPEMLGRVFESLLATQNDATGQQARKAKGAFYTPREIVSYMCKESLRNYLYSAVGKNDDIKSSIDSLLDISDSQWAKSKSNTLRDKIKDYRTQIVDSLDTMTFLDPACGSGAFPMGMLQLCIKTYERLESRFDPYKTKLQIIQNNIFGVDIEPMAIEISRLRAWLSLVVDEEDSTKVEPLPNLDFKFICANSLIPLDESRADLFNDPELHSQLAEIRQKYFNARKPHTKKIAQSKYYKLSGSNTGIFDNLRTKQLKSFDPFSNFHPADFFDINQMFGLEGGFDIVIGNPPYGVKFSKEDKEVLRKIYPESQFKIDSYSLFILLSLRQLKPNAVCSFIIPNTFLDNYFEANVRHKLLTRSQVDYIVDLDDKVFSSAVVHSMVISYINKVTENPSIRIDTSNKLGENFTLIPTDYFLRQEKNVISLRDYETRDLNEKLARNSVDLFDVLDIRQSIKTGDDKKYLGNEKLDENYKIVVRGKDVHRFSLDQKDIYVQYGKHLACPRKPLIFEQPKILMRETGSRITATYDDSNAYVMSSAYTCIPKNSEYDLKYILGLLNSNLYQFLMQNITFAKTKGAFTKAKIFHYYKLPVKILSPQNQEEIVQVVDAIMMDTALGNDTKDLEIILNDKIYRAYELTPEEISKIDDVSSSIGT